MMKSGDQRRSHAPSCTGTRGTMAGGRSTCGAPIAGDSSSVRRVGSGDPSGVSTRWSWGCRKISLEKVIGGGLFQWWLWLLLSFAMTVMRPELTTQRNPNPNIPKLFYGSDTMLREKEYYILIHLQRRNIHIYTLVLGQKRKQS